MHARVEDRICTGKDTGIGHFPSESFAINSAWLAASLIAATLLAWLRLLALDGDLARAEPKALRVLHAAARLARDGRRRRLRIAATWPWADAIAGARILAEIGDGSGFASGAKLAAYAGLAPVTRQSGTSLNAETRSRRGNHRLKNAMFLAAFASLRDPASKAFYDRKRAEGKRHNAALICLARRRCDVILAMLRNRQPYQPDRAKAAEAA